MVKLWKCNFQFSSVHFSSVAQLCPTLCDLVDCSTPGFPVLHHLPEFAQIHVHWVNDAFWSFHPLYPLLLLLSIFPSIRVFSNESVLCIRWPKYWRFSISPSNEYSGLISFRIDWFDLLAIQWTLKSLLQHHSSKASILQLFISTFPMPHHLRVTSLHTVSFMGLLFRSSWDVLTETTFSLPTVITGLSNNDNISTINLTIIISTKNDRRKMWYDIIAILMINAMCAVLSKHFTYILTIKLWSKTMRSALFSIHTFKMKKSGTLKPTFQDFPGDPVAKTPHSKCKGPGFDPSSRN